MSVCSGTSEGSESSWALTRSLIPAPGLGGCKTPTWSPPHECHGLTEKPEPSVDNSDTMKNASYAGPMVASGRSTCSGDSRTIWEEIGVQVETCRMSENSPREGAEHRGTACAKAQSRERGGVLRVRGAWSEEAAWTAGWGGRGSLAGSAPLFQLQLLFLPPPTEFRCSRCLLSTASVLFTLFMAIRTPLEGPLPVISPRPLSSQLSAGLRSQGTGLEFN